MKYRIIEIREGLHARDFGASSGERWINCPGSVLPARTAPRPPTKWAIEGNAAHFVSEMVRKGTPLDEFKQTKIRVHHHDGFMDIPCNGELLQSVDVFVKKVRERNLKFGIPVGDQFIEQMVHYNRWIPEGFGTLDDAALGYQVAFSTDFKHGKGVKKYAAWNPQLMLYGVGLTPWSWLYGRFSKFVLAISQPRLNHYDEWEVSAKDLYDWLVSVARPAALRALQPGAPLKAGPWCQFCPLKPECRVYAAYKSVEQGASASRVRGNDFGSLD